MLTWSADWMLGLRAEWRVYHSYSWLMGLLSVRCVLLIPVALLTVHEMACRRFGFCLVVMTLQLLESGLLYGMAGIGFFQPYLPSSWWRWLSTINAGHLEFVVGMMFAYVVVTLIYLLVHLQVRIRGSGSRFKTHGPIVGLNFH